MDVGRVTRQDIAGKKHSISLVALKNATKKKKKKKGCPSLAPEEGEVLNKNSNDKHMQSSL